MSQLDLAKTRSRSFPLHGWLGLGLAALFWAFNWSLSGPRTHWGFFPMWLGYSLAVDGLVYLRRGTSLLTRSWRKYTGLFLLSAPVWWLFELVNTRLQNWHYDGGELLSPLEFFFWASLSFTTVIPAVFGAAELISSLPFLQRLPRGPVVRLGRGAALGLFAAGWVMLALMLAWPRLFFPFVWISIFFITEPLNIWLGSPSLRRQTERGDWRVVVALWLGVLLTAFFWEMWNYFSYPKWVYSIPWGQFWHIFEMPLLGYGGYLPFALELAAIYHLVAGLLGDKDSDYVQLAIEP